MVTDRIKLIDDISDGSPSRLRESYFIKNYNSVYTDISNFCKDVDIPFIQKIWHWVNNSHHFNCYCGNETTFNRNWKDGYRLYCSPKCAQSKKDTKEKRKSTNLKKYGVDNVSKSSDIKKKIEDTNLRKYGYKSSFQNDDVRSKWKENMISKYGVDHYFKTEDFRIKSKNYYLQRWGVDHPLMVDEIKDKIKQTCLIRYGVETYLNTKHSRDSIKHYNRSKYEDEIYEFILDLGIDAFKSDRTVIPPFLLDIYVPEKNLAIEFNGLYWHSEFKKEKEYHLNKTLGCRDRNVDLIHIWEDDWINRKDILKSIICNKLDIVTDRVFARKCRVVDLGNEEVSNFLNSHHIQGYSRFSKSIGLIYGDELVSVMSFGYRSINGKKEYELIRFCNKINTNVIGGASKLFSHFVKTNLDIDRIISYSDISIFTGNLYKKLGFYFVKRSQINYWWVVDGIRRHRFSFNKKKLVKMGYDPTMTEVEIMHSLNRYRVWGCGQDRWEWSRL